eukprot:PLAT5869.1.p2 GENE.PLAT5869.1~~PLAT5869.1.p2  ORF type:complete len:225 (+),score=104.30 PLAT5869.1:29-676(+)
MKTIAFALLAIAAVAAAGCATTQDFDYLTLEQFWPITECKQFGCQTNTTEFTLHGLWPSLSSGSEEPCFCTNQQFDQSKISDLVGEMSVYWASYESTDASFWAHEYEKHGTCAEKVSSMATEHGFFSTALSLRKKTNLATVLSEAGITPSNSYYYDATTVSSALNKAFGTNTIIQCDDGLLDSVQVCMDASFNYVDCPSSNDESCSGHIYLPADV